MHTDLSYLNEIADGNDEFIVEMLEMFIDKTPEYFFEIKKSLGESNYEQIKSATHKVKPTFAFMGIDKAKPLIVEIERNAVEIRNPESLNELIVELETMTTEAINELEQHRDKLKTN